jgi:hypothetical protein
VYANLRPIGEGREIYVQMVRNAVPHEEKCHTRDAAQALDVTGEITVGCLPLDAVRLEQ